jgi:hypothetical protein
MSLTCVKFSWKMDTRGQNKKKGATFKLSPRSGSIILHFVGYEIGTVQAFLFDSDFGTRISSMPSL